MELSGYLQTPDALFSGNLSGYSKFLSEYPDNDILKTETRRF